MEKLSCWFSCTERITVHWNWHKQLPSQSSCWTHQGQSRYMQLSDLILSFDHPESKRHCSRLNYFMWHHDLQSQDKKKLRRAFCIQSSLCPVGGSQQSPDQATEYCPNANQITFWETIALQGNLTEIIYTSPPTKRALVLAVNLSVLFAPFLFCNTSLPKRSRFFKVPCKSRKKSTSMQVTSLV